MYLTLCLSFITGCLVGNIYIPLQCILICGCPHIKIYLSFQTDNVCSCYTAISWPLKPPCGSYSVFIDAGMKVTDASCHTPYSSLYSSTFLRILLPLNETESKDSYFFNGSWNMNLTLFKICNNLLIF